MARDRLLDWLKDRRTPIEVGLVISHQVLSHPIDMCAVHWRLFAARVKVHKALAV